MSPARIEIFDHGVTQEDTHGRRTPLLIGDTIEHQEGDLVLYTKDGQVTIATQPYKTVISIEAGSPTLNGEKPHTEGVIHHNDPDEMLGLPNPARINGTNHKLVMKVTHEVPEDKKI